MKSRREIVQKGFKSYWISEKQANHQLAWMFFWSLVSLSLTILSLLR